MSAFLVTISAGHTNTHKHTHIYVPSIEIHNPLLQLTIQSRLINDQHIYYHLLPSTSHLSRLAIYLTYRCTHALDTLALALASYVLNDIRICMYVCMYVCMTLIYVSSMLSFRF